LALISAKKKRAPWTEPPNNITLVNRGGSREHHKPKERGLAVNGWVYHRKFGRTSIFTPGLLLTDLSCKPVPHLDGPLRESRKKE
jgi:hypothetical protein